MEFAERVRREALLRTYGELPSAAKRRADMEETARILEEANREVEGEDYQDEFEKGDDYGDSDGDGYGSAEKKKKSGKNADDRGGDEKGEEKDDKGAVCEFVQWTRDPDKRQEGLKYLSDITRWAAAMKHEDYQHYKS